MEYQTKFYHKLTDENKSPVQKYREVIIGSPRWRDLFYYEFVTTLFSSLGGATGLILRKMFYPQMLGGKGKNIFFSKNVSLRCPSQIVMGSNVVVDENCLLDGRGPEKINLKIGNNVFFGRGCLISCHDGTITIGDNTNIGPGGTIISGSKIKLGNNIIMAGGCFIAATTKNIEQLDVPIIAQGSIGEGVIIGENTWLGSGVIINDGVNIGRDCVIGAGAVVVSNIPDYYIAFGVPAKLVRKRN